MYLLFGLLHMLGNNSRHSRFGVFNSRLGLQKFPVGVATGIGLQPIDWASRFFRQVRF
jgi:hypothetical protein